MVPIQVAASMGDQNGMLSRSLQPSARPWRDSPCSNESRGRLLRMDFHVTEKRSAYSIRKYGLQSKSRNAVHFMYHNDHMGGYIAMGKGTKEPRTYGNDRTHFVLNPTYLETAKLYLTQNGIVLSYENMPAEYLVEREQLPTISMNVLNPGRGHILPSEVTSGIMQKKFTYMEPRVEKGDSFVPGGEFPQYVRKTAWEFMNQTTPYWYGKTFFTTPLMTEEAYNRGG